MRRKIPARQETQSPTCASTVLLHFRFFSELTVNLGKTPAFRAVLFRDGDQNREHVVSLLGELLELGLYRADAHLTVASVVASGEVITAPLLL
jgi:hypothetical protein